MSLYVLEGILRVFRIRGHIPGQDGFPEWPARSSPGRNSARMRILVIASAIATVVLLVVCADALLAIKSQ